MRTPIGSGALRTHLSAAVRYARTYWQRCATRAPIGSGALHTHLSAAAHYARTYRQRISSKNQQRCAMCTPSSSSSMLHTVATSTALPPNAKPTEPGRVPETVVCVGVKGSSYAYLKVGGWALCI